MGTEADVPPFRLPYEPSPDESYITEDELLPEDDPYLAELEALQGEEFQPGQFQGRGSFLEPFSGLEQQQHPQPRSFGEGFLYGVSGGLGRAGTQSAKARQRFEESEAERRKAFDRERQDASRLLRSLSGAERRRKLGEQSAERKDRKKFEDENPVLTADQIKEMPHLARVADAEGRVPRDWLKPEKPGAGIKTLDQIEEEAFRRARGARRGAPAVGVGDKPPSRYQIESGNFANRATQADANAMKLEDSGVRVSRLTAKLPFGLADPLEGFQGDKERQYWQAVRQFTEAHLRRESGATITPDELQMIAKAYFAQPGDSKELIDQKRSSRREIIGGLVRGAGSAAPGSAESRVVQPGGRQPRAEEVSGAAYRAIASDDIDSLIELVQQYPELEDDPEIVNALGLAPR